MADGLQWQLMLTNSHTVRVIRGEALSSPKILAILDFMAGVNIVVHAIAFIKKEFKLFSRFKAPRLMK